jgi:hypothetical protein
MITYLTHEQIDKTLWDHCIAQAPNGLVYAWSWYLDIVHPGWDALVEMEGDRYLTVMPITHKRKYFVNYLCQPFFVQQLGVFSTVPVTAETTQAFLKAIPEKYRLVEIRLNEKNPVETSWQGIELHRNHLLDLYHDYNSLSFQYHDNTHRNLKKSLKCDLQLVEGLPIQKVIHLFRNDRGAMVKHWGNAEYARLERLTAAAITSSNAFVYGVKTFDNDDIICGALFMKSHHRITFLFSGNSKVGKEVQAMSFLIDKVIQMYSGQPLVLDFEGSDDENLARFYHGFGGKPVSYPSYTYRWKNPLQ